MKARRAFGGFTAGVMIGALFGSSAVALAAFGYSGWQKFSFDFKGGYIAGFLDMALLARNLDPGGYVDLRYPLITQATSLEWYKTVDEVYKDPKNQNLSMASAMQAASFRLKEKYGVSMSAEQRTHEKMEQQLKAYRQMKAEEAAKKAKEDAKNGGAAPAAKPEGAAKADSAAKAAAPGAGAAVEAPKHVQPKLPRKWCRCDGTDPVKAREARKAKEAAEDAEDGVVAPAPKAEAPAAAAKPPAPATAPPKTPAK